MGRQLPIVATWNDEVQLLRFIQTLSPILPFVSHASQIDDLWFPDWEQREIPGQQYSIWLKAFPWTPEYRQTGGPRCPPASRGLWYVANSNDAPVIEITRPFAGTESGGRVYWAHLFCAPHGRLAYDEEAFTKIVTRIWAWIRRNAHRKHDVDHVSDSYFFPEAWINRSKQAN